MIIRRSLFVGAAVAAGLSTAGSTASAALTGWCSALNKARTSAFQARMGFVGDSETMGLGSSAQGYPRGKAGSYPSALAALMQQRGVHTIVDSLFGNGYADNYEAYKPAVALGGGWSPPMVPR